ncbi:hypothetical protein OKW30_005114 [Paraburkholderia sp. Clong3]|nr:hypothetical protein [Paraburkholderia sp. CI2]MBB5470609.1 hypothetical protein [Paraburkholderia sp. CI2]
MHLNIEPFTHDRQMRAFAPTTRRNSGHIDCTRIDIAGQNR